MTLTALMLALFVSATQPAPSNLVRDAESLRERALVTGDYAALDRLLADDLTYTHSTGRTDTKASYLAPLLSGRTRYTSLTPDDVQVRTYGTSTGVLTGILRSVAMVAGQESRTNFRFTSVWIERDGRWQMVAWQSTKLPD